MLIYHQQFHNEYPIYYLYYEFDDLNYEISVTSREINQLNNDHISWI